MDKAIKVDIEYRKNRLPFLLLERRKICIVLERECRSCDAELEEENELLSHIRNRSLEEKRVVCCLGVHVNRI